MIDLKYRVEGKNQSLNGSQPMYYTRPENQKKMRTALKFRNPLAHPSELVVKRHVGRKKIGSESTIATFKGKQTRYDVLSSMTLNVRNWLEKFKATGIDW